MSRMDKWLVPYMVLSAWLSFVLFMIGCVISSPNGLIEVASHEKDTKEIASYVTAGLHILAFVGCGIANFMMKPTDANTAENPKV